MMIPRVRSATTSHLELLRSGVFVMGGVDQERRGKAFEIYRFRPTYAPRHAGAGQANVGHPSISSSMIELLPVRNRTIRPEVGLCARSDGFGNFGDLC